MEPCLEVNVRVQLQVKEKDMAEIELPGKTRGGGVVELQHCMHPPIRAISGGSSFGDIF